MTAGWSVRRLPVVSTLVVLVAVVAMASTATAAPSERFTYAASGSYTAPPTCGAVDPCDSTFLIAGYDGALSCTDSCTDAPSSASFSLALRPTKLARDYSSSCTFSRANGSVSISWSDSTVSSATVSARAKDHKGYKLSGVIDSGRFGGYLVSGWVSFPVDPIFPTDPVTPCQDGSFSGGLTLLPPSPI